MSKRQAKTAGSPPLGLARRRHCMGAEPNALARWIQAGRSSERYRMDSSQLPRRPQTSETMSVPRRWLAGLHPGDHLSNYLLNILAISNCELFPKESGQVGREFRVGRKSTVLFESGMSIQNSSNFFTIAGNSGICLNGVF